MSGSAEYDLEVLSEGSGDISADIIFVHGLTGGRRSTWTTAAVPGPTALISDPSVAALNPPEASLELPTVDPGSAKEQTARKSWRFFGKSGGKSEGKSKGKSREPKKEKTVCWPEKFLPNELRSACRIMTWGYDADVTHLLRPAGSNTVFQHAKNLVADVERRRESMSERTRPIIFVCHSLGGIVVKDALEYSKTTFQRHLQSVYKACYGVIFLGTPHRGSNKANLGAIATGVLKAFLHKSNSSLVRDLEVNSGTLDRISDAFSRMLKKDEVKVFSFWEELGLTNVIGVGLIVEPFSAILGDPDEGKASIHGNHMTMTKFGNEHDPGYRKVSHEIRRFVEAAAGNAGIIFPSATRESHGPILKDNSSDPIPRQAFKRKYIILPFEQDTFFQWRSEYRLVGDIFRLPAKPIVVLTGLGGAGKTSIAGGYALAWVRETVGSVFWINADTVDTIEQDIKRIVMQVESGSSQQNVVESSVEPLARFHGWLSETDEWLLVFDNADNIKIDFRRYLPPSRSGLILFTSRNSKLVSLLRSSHQVNVNGLGKDEALDMFYSICGRDDVKAEIFVDHQPVAITIVKKLENFPLAIAQAASYLRWYTSFSGADYLRFLQDKAARPELLSFSSDYENYNKTVMTTWEVSHSNLADDPKTSRAADLLDFLGFLDPAGVPEEFLHSALKTEYGVLGQSNAESTKSLIFLRDDLDFRLYVDTLVSLSLVTRNTDYRDAGFLKLHPLVHEWIRVRLGHGESGRATHIYLLGFASALVLHNVHITCDWRKTYDNERTAENALLRLRLMRTTSDRYGIETVLLFGSAALYRQWKDWSADVGILQRHYARVSDDHHVWRVNSYALLSMLREYFYLSWAESDEFWSLLDYLGEENNEQHLQKYIDCVLAGLRCLRSLAKALQGILTTDLETEPEPMSTLYPNSDAALASFPNLHDEFSKSLEEVWHEDLIAQQFKKWAESHDHLPPLSEDDLRCSWYSHFRHTRCLLVAAINGFLWPRYLYLSRPWSDKIAFPQYVMEAFFALDERLSAKCWDWEYQPQTCTVTIIADRGELLVKARFVKLYAAGRLQEAEKMIQTHIANHQLEAAGNGEMAELQSQFVEVVAECMRRRKDHRACKEYLMSAIDGGSKRALSWHYWGVQDVICRLATDIMNSQSLQLTDAEDILVLEIVLTLSDCNEDGKSWHGGPHELSFILGEINPICQSAFALGRVYEKAERYLEAATLTSWALDYWISKTPREQVKFLICNLRRLYVVDEGISSALLTEADEESEYRRRERTRGPYAVVCDRRFEDARIKVREMEQAAQSVKTLFYDSLKRMGRVDFNTVDLIWETMLTRKGAFQEN